LEKVTGNDPMYRAIETFGRPRNIQRYVRPRSLGRFLQFRTMVIAWAFFAGTGLLAQQPKPSEYQVKAAYLYNFGRFVKWPAGISAVKGDSFAVCVLGLDPYGQRYTGLLAARRHHPVRRRRRQGSLRD
jgi:hypothetical protein